MDFPIQWALGVLRDLVPEPTLVFIHRHILDPSSPIQSLRLKLSSFLSLFLSNMYTLLAPALDRLAQALASSPDVVVLAVFVAIVFFIIQLLSYLQRIMLFWTRLAFRALFWSGVVLLGAVVWQRGLEASARDAMVITSKVLGFLLGVKDFFMSEYSKYEELERLRKMQAAGTAGRMRGW